MRPVRDRLWTVARPLVAGRSRVDVRDVPVVSDGGWPLHARFWRPQGDAPVPALLLVPGIGGTSSSFEGWKEPVNVRELASLGCAVLAYDPAGRGKSWGSEDYGGPGQQGDVRACLRELAVLPGVDASRIGVLSFSLGAAAVAGALAAGDRPPVAFWIDWEGPSDREIITAGGRRMDPAMGHGLDDDRYWWPREPVRFVGRTGTPYLRYQSIRDHAQPGETRHAERMIRAAAEGDLPWFQLDDHPRGEVPARPVWMPPGLRPARTWLHARVRELHRLA